MFKRIKNWLSLKRIELSDTPLPAAKEKVDDSAMVRVKKQPFSQEQMSSMVPHAADCVVIGCVKNPCFTYEPDKIVSKPYEVKRKVPMSKKGVK